MTPIILSLVFAMTTSSYIPEFSDQELVEYAVHNCRNVKAPASVDQDFLHWMLDRERYYGVPMSLRGMTLAAACNESGYNENAKGDWTTVQKRGRKYRHSRARGIMQLWPWFAKKYGVNRHDRYENVDVWLYHMRGRLDETVPKYCPKKWKEKKRWLAAWVQTTRGRINKANRYRCYQRASHYKMLTRWYRAIRKTKTKLQ